MNLISQSSKCILRNRGGKMSKINPDVFKSYLFEGISYSGELEIPVLHSSHLLPNELIPFSKARGTKDFNLWVHFYEDDKNFMCVWNQPKKYLTLLQKFYGVISPDFSVQRNMPLFKQIELTARGRLLGCWWRQNGIEVIPNVRFNGDRTYKFAFEGLDKNSNLAIGSLGCIKNKTERDYFVKGLAEMIRTLKPKNLVVYGAAPKTIFEPYVNKTKILHFPSQTTLIHKKESV